MLGSSFGPSAAHSGSLCRRESQQPSITLRLLSASGRRVRQCCARRQSTIAIELAQDADTNAGAFAFVNVAVDVEAGMHHRHVGREKAHMHLRRLAGARSEPPDAWRRVSFAHAPVSILGWIDDPTDTLPPECMWDAPHLALSACCRADNGRRQEPARAL